MIKAMVQRNPQLLGPLLQQLGQINPQILQLVNQHQAEFMALLNEPVQVLCASSALIPFMATTVAFLPPFFPPLNRACFSFNIKAGAGGGQGGAPQGGGGPQYIQVTPEEKEAIDRVREREREREQRFQMLEMYGSAISLVA